MEIYDRLWSHLGPSHWWPGDTPLEVVVGAVLTQNTAWGNVEKAIRRIKKEDGLSAGVLAAMDEETLWEWIRPTGYYRLKAKRLKNVMTFLVDQFSGQVEKMQVRPMEVLRQELLAVNGIGPETADSILLYALGLPSFVVDTYTHRIFSRHQWVPEEFGYDDLRAYFMDRLPPAPNLYNEYHALLVRLGKETCKKNNPRCGECPLKTFDSP